MRLIVQTASGFVIVLCAIVVIAVLVLLPDVFANGQADPENLILAPAWGLASVFVGTLVGFKTWGKRRKWVSVAALVLAAVIAIQAVFAFLSGGWPVALIAACVAAVLLTPSTSAPEQGPNS